MMQHRVQTGRDSETLALEYLQDQGLKILERNMRCPLGEVDLVALDGKTYVFVEIRSLRSTRWGSAEESISRTKKLRVVRVALWYLKSRGLAGVPVRFDVVAVQWRGEDLRIRWIPGAFDAQGLG
ncbi:MAG: YraN family protein [Desulfosoma sp.]